MWCEKRVWLHPNSKAGWDFSDVDLKRTLLSYHTPVLVGFGCRVEEYPQYLGKSPFPLPYLCKVGFLSAVSAKHQMIAVRTQTRHENPRTAHTEHTWESTHGPHRADMKGLYKIRTSATLLSYSCYIFGNMLNFGKSQLFTLTCVYYYYFSIIHT